jgi:hypothetical protein
MDIDCFICRTALCGLLIIRRKDGRKEDRKEGRKEGRKLGRQKDFYVIDAHC